MRKSLIAGNWKMNMTRSETSEMLKNLLSITLSNDVEKIIFPPYTSIDRAVDILKSTDIQVGAQNLSEFSEGAYTGEISAKMLVDLKVTHVIVGHSERRRIFAEDDKKINSKVKMALEEGLKVILCLGEPQEIRDKQEQNTFVKEQLQKSLENVQINFEDLIIAYEPIWAIGTGNTCDPDVAEEMCKFIRNNIEELSDKNTANKMRILYGGSVKPDNIKEIMNKENIDGALVGGASLNSEDFSKIINFEVEI
ncbi:Triose-phosphate isomerase [Peptoniphilus sp. ING2-D1G]|nr:Triose-phosphate isomerase [Peptoniphilus sp. ING2-D1G]